MSGRSSEGYQRRKLPSTNRDLRDGLSLFRRPYGQVLEVCQEMAELEQTHPYLEVRGLHDDPGNIRQLFRVQELRHREIARKGARIGHVLAREALETMFDQIPSLNEELPVAETWVDTSTDRSGATYVSLVPSALDLLKLAGERYQELRIIEALAGSKKLVWDAGYFDLVVAYIPLHAGPGTIEDTVNFLESRDTPTSFTLLPADF